MRYAVGLDYGTLSARCLLIELDTGKECVCVEYEYPHGVMDGKLPDGTPLQREWALQYPMDYIQVLGAIKQALSEAGVDPRQIVSIGLVCTSCSPLPILNDGTPLCCLEEFYSEPNAYVKLWKHHSAQPYADRFTKTALERGEKFINLYGGKISSEWLFPKLFETLDLAPDVYHRMDHFVEAGDWIVYCLCGKLLRNNSALGAKGMWSKELGFPSKEYFEAVDPRLSAVVEDKISSQIAMVGTMAGRLCEKASEWTGLPVGTPVAVAHLDGHGIPIGAGISSPGKMLCILGTSACNLIMTEEYTDLPGICGGVSDIIVPGYIGIESGQSAFGDHFSWFVKNCVPSSYQQEANERGVNIYKLLSDKAAAYAPGETGMIALDWWNGNRSILVDASLSGMMLGFTLRTKPEDIFRTLLEATAFGMRVIMDNYEKYGIVVEKLVAAGGITGKNPLFMQMLADITGKQIELAYSRQVPALSAAIWGTLAAGAENGGFNTLDEALSVVRPSEVHYYPDAEASKKYAKLYDEYVALHDYFGCGENDVMKRLKKLAAGKQEK